MPTHPAPLLQPIPSVKLEIFLPVYYRPKWGRQIMYVDPADVALYLNNIAGKYGKYGGYSMSNPMAAPPIQGTYQKSPPEGSFWIMMIVPEHLRDAAIKDFQQMVSKFQQDYNQKEILFLVSSLTRYSP